MKVTWYCGHYVGPMKWQTTEIYEPDECDTEFETEETQEDWDYECCGATCPKCGADLWQSNDEAVLSV